jgi:predicted dithiol-disulfide oxidoreductase (DUF899 family)
MGSTWSYLDITALGRQEKRKDWLDVRRWDDSDNVVLRYTTAPA